MAKTRTYSFITTITARTEADAESAREECGGGIEDARESGYFPDGVDVDAGELVGTDLDAVLNAYRDFHDTLSDMIEGGRLSRDTLPDDYLWLVDAMEKIGALDVMGTPKRELEEEE